MTDQLAEDLDRLWRAAVSDDLDTLAPVALVEHDRAAWLKLPDAECYAHMCAALRALDSLACLYTYYTQAVVELGRVAAVGRQLAPSHQAPVDDFARGIVHATNAFEGALEELGRGAISTIATLAKLTDQRRTRATDTGRAAS